MVCVESACLFLSFSARSVQYLLSKPWQSAFCHNDSDIIARSSTYERTARLHMIFLFDFQQSDTALLSLVFANSSQTTLHLTSSTSDLPDALESDQVTQTTYARK